jgi:hypothetical protein
MSKTKIALTTRIYAPRLLHVAFIARDVTD